MIYGETIGERLTRLQPTGYGRQGGSSADHMAVLRLLVDEGRGHMPYSSKSESIFRERLRNYYRNGFR